MSTQTHNNSRIRRSLADQIDRLDGVIDALSIGLNEAVATVVQEAVSVAVKQAVQATLTEVLTNPDLQQKLAQPFTLSKASPVSAQPQQPKSSSWWQRLSCGVQAGWGWLVGKVSQVGSAVGQTVQHGVTEIVTCAGSVCQQVQRGASHMWTFLVLAWSVLCYLRKPLLIASAVGLVVGLGGYCAGPVVSSTITGFTGFAASLIASTVRTVWGELVGTNQQSS